MVSVIAVVCNEAERLPSFIQRARQYAGEIVLVVQESTDDTLLVAHDLADTVIEAPCLGFCEPHRRLAAEASTGDWLLLLDADEHLSPWCIEQLPTLMNGEYDGWRLWRLTDVEGKVLENDWHYRLFNRNSVVFLDNIHSGPQPTSTARVGRTEKMAIFHRKNWIEQHADDERWKAVLRGEYGDASVQLAGAGELLKGML